MFPIQNRSQIRSISETIAFELLLVYVYQHSSCFLRQECHHWQTWRIIIILSLPKGNPDLTKQSEQRFPLRHRDFSIHKSHTMNHKLATNCFNDWNLQMKNNTSLCRTIYLKIKLDLFIIPYISQQHPLNTLYIIYFGETITSHYHITDWHSLSIIQNHSGRY